MELNAGSALSKDGTFTAPSGIFHPRTDFGLLRTVTTGPVFTFTWMWKMIRRRILFCFYNHCTTRLRLRIFSQFTLITYQLYTSFVSGEHIPLVSLQKYSSKGEADNLCSSSGIEHQDLIVRCSKLINIEKGKIAHILMTSILNLVTCWWQINNRLCFKVTKSLYSLTMVNSQIIYFQLLLVIASNKILIQNKLLHSMYS